MTKISTLLLLRSLPALPLSSRWASVACVGAPVGLALGLLLASTNVGAAKLYRYQDADKNWVLASTVPNERVKNGYQVVDETGRVIEEVDPQRGPVEAAIYIKKLEAKQARDEAVRRINQLYGSEKDIDYALKKALRSIDSSLANSHANIRQLRGRKQRLETQAARIERAGNVLSIEMVENISGLNKQIDNLGAEIDQRNNQKQVERERHARDRRLFREENGCPEAAKNRRSSKSTS